MPIPGQSCQNCPSYSGDQWSLCFRHPPEQWSEVSANWPKVLPTDWCGDWGTTSAGGGGGGGGIPEAPTDGALYGRQNAAWSPVAAAPAPSSTNPVMDGTAAVGTGTTYARADHVHPSDTSRVNKAGDTMTGALTVAGLTDNKHAAIGANAAIDNVTWAPGDPVNAYPYAQPCMLTLNEFYTGDVSVIDGIEGLMVFPGYRHTGTAAGSIWVLDIEPTINSNSTGPLTNFYGIYAVTANYGSGAITNHFAAHANAGHLGTGTVTNLFGGNFLATVSGSTAIATNVAAVHVARNGKTSGGTITNNYGIYIADQSGIGTTTSENIHSFGAASTNTFEGTVNAKGFNLTSTSTNVAIGNSAGNTAAVTGTNNVTIGLSAGSSLTTGGSNICIGPNTGMALQTGSGIVNVGSTAGQYATGGSNVHVGNVAGRGVSGTTTGGNNTFVGCNAGQNYTTNTSCTYVGNFAGYAATSGNQSTCIGYQAGYNMTTGATNTIVGSGAGAGVVAGNGNILIGQGANVPSGDPSGYINIGNNIRYDNYNNVMFGSGAGNAANVTGTFNVNIGLNAGAALTTGAQNVNIGLSAGTSLTTASNIVNIGTNAGRYSTGASNVIIGNSAGLGVSGSTTGTSNVFIGSTAGTAFTTAGSNVCVGNSTGAHLTTGTSCTFVGTQAGANATTNNYNTCLGNLAGVNITTGANNTILGARQSTDAIVTGNGNILIGYNANAPSDTTNYINIGGLITGQMDTGPIAISKAVNFTGSIGVNGTTAPAKPTVTGAKGSNAALASLIAALVSYGLITDSTTA
jgi:hypothetical protein